MDPQAQTEEAAAGGGGENATQVWTWGLAGKVNCLGHEHADRELVCAFPRRVPLPSVRKVGYPVQVAAGEACCAAVTSLGRLLVWGSGRGGRLGLGDEEPRFRATVVRPLVAAGVHVVQVSIGEAHMGCVGRVDEDGQTRVRAWVWGKGFGAMPEQVELPDDDDVTQIACGYRSTMVVCASGALYAWGSNANGRLGVGHTETVTMPTLVEGLPEVVSVGLGSRCAGAVCADGSLYTWGYGRYGNLGHGDRASRSSPARVEALVEAGVRVAHVHMTVGQINPKKAAYRGARAFEGQEGPHMFVVSDAGAVYGCGTCHKGMLGNLAKKTLAAPYDELVPYEIGSPCRDDPSVSGYLDGERVVQACASSIHSAIVCASGTLYTLGCGSSGRMGVRAYTVGLHGARSRMKCYISRPTPVEAFQDRNLAVLQCDVARRHMIALVRPHAPAAADTPHAAGSGEGGGDRRDADS